MAKTNGDARRDERLDVGAEALARVYAEAYLNAAEAAGQVEAQLEELDSFLDEVLAKNPQFDELLRSGMVGRDEKEAILDRTLGERASELFLNFLKTVNRHDRLHILRDIRRQVRLLYDKRRNRVRVEVRSAVPLASDVSEKIRGRLAQLLRGEPVLDNTIDPALLGGLVIRIGDRVFDYSVARQLERLRGRIIERSLHEIQSGRDRFGASEGD